MSDPDESFTAFDEVLRGRLTRKGTTHQDPRTAAPAHARPSESDDANPSPSRKSSKEPTLRRNKKNPETKRTALRVKSMALISFLLDFKPRIPFALIAYDDDHHPRMFIDAPYYDLFFAHGALKSSLASATGARLRPALAELIDFIEDHFKDTFTKRERSLRDGNIAFGLAWTLFAPGTLLYARQPTLAPGVAYEECGVATTSAYVEHDGDRRILSVRMQNCMFTGARFRRVRARHHIGEFAGERRLDSTEWAVIPLDLLAEDEQAAIRNRLVERGKRCVQLLSERPVRLGEYDGPVRMVWEVPNKVMNTMLRWESSWNWVICGFVLPSDLSSSPFYSILDVMLRRAGERARADRQEPHSWVFHSLRRGYGRR
ncbi:hypothetical protein MAPG_07234 [Magnaporthiopsis poae ATCC 64411]|uniref:DUF7025 domain-containing protein n=1 Tax=Magnaporthiopsis poae (strain ATCC 64411 / 73-15) TaxID=644358 RepID=A0A0C4E446_MAGP6|nr:hypothetical protein MAPG_07234 [Magnaporthiopsis poae ATCC 64411]